MKLSVAPVLGSSNTASRNPTGKSKTDKSKWRRKRGEAGRTVGGVNVDGGDGWRDEEEEEAAERVGGGEDQKRPPEGHGVVWGLRVRRRIRKEGEISEIYGIPTEKKQLDQLNF
jgi:hypothetical protein